MSTPQTSSSRPKAPRTTLALGVGGALLVGVSLLSGAVLRGGGLVAAGCVLLATTAALWLFVLFAARMARGRDAHATPRIATAGTAPPEWTPPEPRLHEQSHSQLRFSDLARAARDSSPAADREHPGRISGTTRRLRVLLIDDEELVLRSTARLLEIRGYSVVTARDYTEALAVAEREPELLLAVTDVVLSGISGKEVVRALRQLHPRLRVVYVSGYDVASSGIHLATDGSEEFLPKPFAPAVLDRRLRALLGLGDRSDEVVSIGA
jgi:CheY-like chemotaxis protein